MGACSGVKPPPPSGRHHEHFTWKPCVFTGQAMPLYQARSRCKGSSLYRLLAAAPGGAIRASSRFGARIALDGRPHPPANLNRLQRAAEAQFDVRRGSGYRASRGRTRPDFWRLQAIVADLDHVPAAHSGMPTVLRDNSDSAAAGPISPP